MSVHFPARSAVTNNGNTRILSISYYEKTPQPLSALYLSACGRRPLKGLIIGGQAQQRTQYSFLLMPRSIQMHVVAMYRSMSVIEGMHLCLQAHAEGPRFMTQSKTNRSRKHSKIINIFIN